MTLLPSNLCTWAKRPVPNYPNIGRRKGAYPWQTGFDASFSRLIRLWADGRGQRKTREVITQNVITPEISHLVDLA